MQADKQVTTELERFGAEGVRQMLWADGRLIAALKVGERAKGASLSARSSASSKANSGATDVM